MGHRMADLDAVGAAVGLVSLCRKKGKRARIVLDLKNNAAGALIRSCARCRNTPGFSSPATTRWSRRTTALC